MSAPAQAPTTIFEFEGCVWFNGSGFDALPDSEPEWPSVEICRGDESFAELWIGQADSMCVGASQRSKRVMLRFLLGELVKQAVAEFVESYQTWQTDADIAKTRALVRKLEAWLTDLCQHEL